MTNKYHVNTTKCDFWHTLSVIENDLCVCVKRIPCAEDVFKGACCILRALRQQVESVFPPLPPVLLLG